MSSRSSKKAVLEASGRFGDCPAFAVLEVTPEFLRHVKRRSVLVETNGLAFALEYYTLDWERNDVFEMRGEMMWVRSGSIFFRGHPKHSRREAETWCVLIAELEQFLDSDNEVVFYGRNTAMLAEKYNKSVGRKDAA